MIISSLCEYHDYMERRGDVLPEGYSIQKIMFRICLSKEGDVVDIINLGKADGKKKVYPDLLLPKRIDKTGIGSNIIEHRPLYIFGLNCEKGEFSPIDKTSKAKKSHEAFVKTNLAFIDGLTSHIAVAYKNFIEKWVPEEQVKNTKLKEIAKDYSTATFDFCLDGYVHDEDSLEYCDEVKAKWDKIRTADKENEEAALTAMCPVYGEELPVAKLHNKIKGVKGGHKQASGCILVCFNNASENSYCKKQAYNSGISQKAMEKYTEALNFLLKDRRHHTYIDDLTVVYFAMTEKEENYLTAIECNLFSESDDNAAKSNDKSDPEVVNENVGSAIKDISSGSKSDFSYFEDIDPNVKYCIFGLAPNSSRVAVKFFYTNTFGNLKKNIEKYNEDFAIGNQKKAPPIWRIKGQLKSTAAVPVDISEDMLRSIIQGAPFPNRILSTVIRRIKTDSDDDKNHFVKMNDVRMGLLKACLNRKNRNKEEKIKMILDEKNYNPAYLCGRLFAVLEKIQQDASEGSLNRTIKDAYFSSASSNPATIFPRLLKLSNYHIAKIASKRGVASKLYYNNLIGDILEKLAKFPKNTTLEEQGEFMLGYYHQNKALYTKKENMEE